ncbi:MAG: dihydroorotase family protein [Deltaproteobacteria bacterium]|nr:dihydroorotase family protein [Deltaproteobacteria bacterium]
MILTHAHWLTADGTFQEGSILVEQGRIRLEPGDPGPEPGPDVLDATGSLVLPGLVDPHVHLRQPGQSGKEGVANGSRAAAAGGITTLLDMPNDRPPTTTAARVAAKAAIFRQRCRVHWGLHVQASRRPVDVDPSIVASAKLYMARGSPAPAIRDPDGVEAVLRRWPRVTVHAEDEARFDPQRRPHDLARPREAVVAALATLESALRRIPEPRRPRLVLCHASTREEVAWVRRLKAEGFDLWGETCPHYLVFTADDAHRAGARLQVNPPIREPADREALLEAVSDGALDWIGTDHAPHRLAEKTGPNPPSGIAGAEWALPLLLRLRDRGILSWRRLVEVGCARAATCYGIAGRDGIREGAVADLVLVRPSRMPQSEPPVTRAGIHPYQDVPLDWQVQATVVGGVVVYRDGVFPEFQGELPGRRVIP